MNEDNTDFFTLLTFGQVFDRSLLIFRRSFVPLLAVGFVTILPAFLLALVGVWIHHTSAKELWDAVTQEFDMGALLSLFDGMDEKNPHGVGYLVLLHGLVSVLAILFLKASVILLVSKRYYLEERPTLGGIFGNALRCLPKLLCWTLLCLTGSAVLILVFAVVFYLLQEFLWVLLLGNNTLAKGSCAALFFLAVLYVVCFVFITFLFCIPCMVVERTSPFGVFARAWKLISEQRLFVFYSLVVHFNLAALLVLVVVVAVTLPMGHVATFAGLHVVELFLAPLQQVLVTVLYWNARVHAEGCDQAMARSETRAAPLLNLDALNEEEEEAVHPLAERLLENDHISAVVEESRPEEQVSEIA